MGDYLPGTISQPKLARKTYRWLAALIDYILFFSCFTVCLIFFGEKHISEDGVVGYEVNNFPGLLVIASWWLLFPVLEGTTGQTLGKAIFNIKVIKADGTKASFGNCVVRHLFDFVDYIPFLGFVGIIVASNNNLKQRVGDLVAKTIVVPSK